MPIYDYGCTNDHVFEVRCKMDDRPAELPCEVCGEPAHQVIAGATPVLTTIIPSYPGCLSQKAGYVHSHGNRSATKTQVGFGGAVQPRESTPFVKNWIKPDFGGLLKGKRATP